MLEIDTEGRVELFRARVGSRNYNLHNENSDEDWKVFVLPTFDDLYTGNMYSTPTHVSEELDYSAKDIRMFGKQIYKANITFLEILYSDKLVFNTEADIRGREYIEELFKMRDKIAMANLPVMYEACIGMHKQRIKALSKGSASTKHLVEKYGYCTKNAMHSYRYLDFLSRFAVYCDFEKALRYTDGTQTKDFIMSIREGSLGNINEATKTLERYHKKTESYIKHIYKDCTLNQETIDKVNDLIRKIVKANIDLIR